MGRLHIVGVRHHSPACARLAQSVIRATKPAFVLIEGPSDMNDRLDELSLDHDPPIALFSFLRSEHETDRSSWYPVCASSPEWVALRTASEVGSTVKFMDLPAWHRAFGERVNLSSDGEDRYGQVIERLCARTGTVGLDALWDHLFEGVEDLSVLAEALDTYFTELRALGDASDGDLQREEHMRAWILAALSRDEGDVVVVCGGFHGPAIRVDLPTNPIDWPAPIVPDEGTAETYLVPYANERLDSFTGYQSGMPSPAYYDILYADGAQAAADEMLRRVVMRLRLDRQTVSTADLVALSAVVEGLARLRGHRVPLRVDLLDGIATALLKTATESALPWEERGPLNQRTHPLLAHVIMTFRGDQIGALDPRTPRPPLLQSAMSELEAVGIVVTERATTLHLDRTKPNDAARAKVLHRLRILGVPGFSRVGSGISIDETWTVQFVLERDVALIEASVYGPTLTTAATGRLLHFLQVATKAGSSVDAAWVLLDAILADLDALTADTIRTAAVILENDSDLPRLSTALDVFRLLLGDSARSSGELVSPKGRAPVSARSSGELVSPKGRAPVSARSSGELAGSSTLHAQIIGVAQQGVERFLWLLEQLRGSAKATDIAIIKGVASAVELVRRFDSFPGGLAETLARRAVDRDCPAGVRGACLGAVWNLELVDDGHELALNALGSIGPDENPGDLLGGLFATARRQFVQHPDLIGAVDAMVAAWTPDEFLELLPAIREAFGWFPSRERSQLGGELAKLHGLSSSHRMVTQLYDDPFQIAAGNAFDAQVAARLKAFGLDIFPQVSEEAT
jgi:hypothetical protein